MERSPVNYSSSRQSNKLSTLPSRFPSQLRILKLSRGKSRRRKHNSRPSCLLPMKRSTTMQRFVLSGLMSRWDIVIRGIIGNNNERMRHVACVWNVAKEAWMWINTQDVRNMRNNGIFLWDEINLHVDVIYLFVFMKTDLHKHLYFSDHHCIIFCIDFEVW